MRVFNLTPETKIYKGKPIPPDGGSVDFPTLDFIPDRDRDLERKRVLAFGSLPAWFVREKAVRTAPPKTPVRVVAAAVKAVVVEAPVPEAAVVEAAPDSEKKESKKDWKGNNRG